MVVSGFSLLEIRKLYIDELEEYYKSLAYVLEKKGEIKEGTFNKIESADTVSQLRSQLFKVMKPPQKK